jgi:hypothetical protein
MPSSVLVATLIADPARAPLSVARIDRAALALGGFERWSWLGDLAMLEATGLGVAYRAKPGVAAAAHARIDHRDLTALLFAQGITRREFVEG